jgi:hypothetical protein
VHSIGTVLCVEPQLLSLRSRDMMSDWRSLDRRAMRGQGGWRPEGNEQGVVRYRMSANHSASLVGEAAGTARAWCEFSIRALIVHNVMDTASAEGLIIRASHEASYCVRGLGKNAKDADHRSRQGQVVNPLPKLSAAVPKRVLSRNACASRRACLRTMSTEMDASSPEVMLAYYKRLFPFKSIFTWLNHAHQPAKLFTHREFAFTLPGDVYLRYQSFNSGDELKKQVCSLNPSRFEIGPVYSARVRPRRAFCSRNAYLDARAAPG